MNNQNFTAALLVDQTPKEVFDAINNVRAWWLTDAEGDSQKNGDEFSVRFDDVHYTRQKLVDVIPNKKVAWLITDSDLSFIKDTSEWKDTKVVFEIAEKNNKTEIRFTHEGLVPEVECFGACSNGWNYFLGSLVSLITTGKGQPHQNKIVTTANSNV